MFLFFFVLKFLLITCSNGVHVSRTCAKKRRKGSEKKAYTQVFASNSYNLAFAFSMWEVIVYSKKQKSARQKSSTFLVGTSKSSYYQILSYQEYFIVLNNNTAVVLIHLAT